MLIWYGFTLIHVASMCVLLLQASQTDDLTGESGSPVGAACGSYHTGYSMLMYAIGTTVTRYHSSGFTLNSEKVDMSWLFFGSKDWMPFTRGQLTAAPSLGAVRLQPPLPKLKSSVSEKTTISDFRQSTQWLNDFGCREEGWTESDWVLVFVSTVSIYNRVYSTFVSCYSII